MSSLPIRPPRRGPVRVASALCASPSEDCQTAATAWPDVTKHIEKLIMLVIFLSLLPWIIACLKERLSKRNEKPTTREEA
jgi:hypothetical protein